MTLNHGGQDIMADRTVVQKLTCKSKHGFLCTGWKKRPKELTPRCYYEEGGIGRGKEAGEGGEEEKKEEEGEDRQTEGRKWTVPSDPQYGEMKHLNAWYAWSK